MPTSTVVKTLDNKMLQDTVAGVILTHRRPHLVQNNTFIEGRVRGNDHRKPELVYIFEGDETPDGIDDAAFGAAWKKAIATGSITVPEVISATDKAGINAYKKAVKTVLDSLTAKSGKAAKEAEAAAKAEAEAAAAAAKTAGN